MKRTPLFAAHQRLGGKLIPFGGWAMPVQYTSITDEHLAVRNAAGLFDISHMGEVTVSGPGAAAFLNTALTNDVNKLTPGLGQYTLMCNEQGGTVDDLYCYRLGESDYLLIVNASRSDADFAWLQSLRSHQGQSAEVQLKNASQEFGAVAVQGPRVAAFINRCFSGPSSGGTRASSPTDLKKNEIGQFRFRQVPVWVSRTGYTGEDGFEVLAPADKIESVWNAILEAGASDGIKPAGLGARDTLRTEMCYPLYGHELDEQTSPLEAGVGFFVALDKPDFVGKSALVRQKQQGLTRKLAAFKMTERSAPPRPDYPVLNATEGQQRLGKVVSGTQSPSLNIGIGMAYVAPEFARAGTPIFIEIRGRKSAGQVVPKPIYRKAG